MVGRAAAAPGTGQQRIEQGTQQVQLPALARAEDSLERLAQLAHFPGRHLLRLRAEDAIHQGHGFGQPGHQRI
ncbi:hypothetical protein SDC9_197497 [bioreactor metagenome]|uniref:Uncharacterized protein n=1 Tax=bioreactor metagenome TaxID=1076179 RepID=A0A645IRG9_9ZZZZ